MSQHRTNAGFALIDALIALLLFAVVLLASMAALLHGMRATHDAMLTSRAVDLAADFLEERRAQPDNTALQPLFENWNERVHSTLPESASATALALVQPLLPASAATTP